jgi:hypothetical protein
MNGTDELGTEPETIHELHDRDGTENETSDVMCVG